MTDRCTDTSSRARTYSSNETSSQPTDEQREAESVGRTQDAEREAEARRNAYYSSGGDEGGRCARASSDASRYSPMLPDDPHLKDARKTAAVDRPLQDDPYGNAIVGAVAGGIAGGVRAASVEALFPGGGGRPVIEHIAIATAKEVAKEAAKTAVVSTMHAAPELAASKETKDVDPKAKASSPAGRSGAKGTSEPAPEPNQSIAPSPYTPLMIRG